LPLKYLGLPLSALFKAKSAWDSIIEKMERKLASWKGLYLSKGDPVTLIKKTLSNLVTNFLSCFPILVSVPNHLEKLQSDFLWSGLDVEPKFYLVNWKKVCSSIHLGGLGIRNLSKFNKALLGNWLWRLAVERGLFGARLWIKSMGVGVGVPRGSMDTGFGPLQNFRYFYGMDPSKLIFTAKNLFL